MDKLDAFKALEKDAWYGKQYKKLTKAQLAFCHDFIRDNGHLCKNEYAKKANRCLMDLGFASMKKSEKSRYLVCQELLSAIA